MADVGPKRRCLALLVVDVQLLGALSNTILEVQELNLEKAGQPVHIAILSRILLVQECHTSLVLTNLAVYILAIVAETHPYIEFSEILLAVSGPL
jgi:hypothetical protein